MTLAHRPTSPTAVPDTAPTQEQAHRRLSVSGDCVSSTWTREAADPGLVRRPRSSGLHAEGSALPDTGPELARRAAGLLNQSPHACGIPNSRMCPSGAMARRRRAFHQPSTPVRSHCSRGRADHTAMPTAQIDPSHTLEGDNPMPIYGAWAHVGGENGSWCRIRTCNPPVNSRMLYR